MQNNAKKIAKIALVSTLFLIIIIYVFFRAKDLIFGVKIKNVNLVDGAKITESVIKVSGNAKNAIFLTLDGREISIDQNGNFTETISLLKGYNVVDIYARDKFGHQDEKIYKLTY